MGVVDCQTMKLVDTSEANPGAVRHILTHRDEEDDQRVEGVVREILAAVRRSGDEAVVGHTRKFDWPDATAETLLVPESEIAEASRSVPAGLIEVFRRSAVN